MPLSALLERFQTGPGEPRWNGKPTRIPIVLVAAPGQSRIRTVAELPEFRFLILDGEEKRFRTAIQMNGILFIILAAVCILISWLWGVPGIFVLAIYAAGTGGAALEALVGIRRLRRDPELHLHALAAQARYAFWENSGGLRNRLWSYALVGAWIIVGIAQFTVCATKGMANRPDILAAGLVKSGVPTEPWRLLTGPMLHGSIPHLFMNFTAAVSLALMIERSILRRLVFPIWVLGALSGSLLSWILSPQTSVGASGGILALFGFLLVAGWRRKALLPPGFASGMVRNLLLVAMLGLIAWQIIDNAAHLGGLVCGAAMGLWAFRHPSGSLPMEASLRLKVFGACAEATYAGLTILTVALLLRRA